MHTMWHKNTTVYELDLSLFQDGNGDGHGDFRGLFARLDYLRMLGVDCIWINPFYRSPFRDGGYDIVDHLQVDPRFGDIADFVAFMERADDLGIRVIVELVGHHTSDQHPWFQQARCDPDSPYRDYYIWSDEPVDTYIKPVFPDAEDSVWAWDEQAGQYYRHAFYSFQPDLNMSNPRVREELLRIMAFWLRLGVSGFRLDACSLMVQEAGNGRAEDGQWWLEEMHEFVRRRCPDAVLLGEADVPIKQYKGYLGEGRRLTWMLDFWLNNFTFLSMARGDAGSLYEAIDQHVQLPPDCSMAVWLRNHDELDLDRLDEARQQEVYDAFGPDPCMRIHDHGIRRRLAPMLGGDRARIAMAHSILFSLPGVPIIRYGEEIGMGDDLEREGRLAVRTPMQWNDGPNGGFSSADPDQLVVTPIEGDGFGYREVNVEAQIGRPDSLLSLMRNFITTRQALREMTGPCCPVVLDAPSVLGLRYADPTTASELYMFTNLSPDPVCFELTDHDEDLIDDDLNDVLANRCYEAPTGTPVTVELDGYGYRWMRRRMTARALERRGVVDSQGA